MRKLIFGSLPLVLLAACGDAKFGGGSSKKKSHSGDASPIRTDPGNGSASGTAYNSISWLWQCAAAGNSGNSSAPASSDTDPVFWDAGEHPLDGARVNGVPLNFSGKFCTPRQMERDIVFVIDISTSMDDNDPSVAAAGGTTCGRRKAVEQVIASIPAGSDVQYSIVTFSSASARAGRTSSGFFRDQPALFADIAGTTEPGAILCATNGNTEYTDGLTRAKGLLERGRPAATKEVYFVSDGNPNYGYEGLQIAEQLKKPGVAVGGVTKPVLIATVMIGTASGTILRDNIASKGPDGAPLFARSTADQLAAVLAGFAQNKIAGGEIRYRPAGSATPWTSIPLLTFTQGYEFVVPSITIDVDVASRGLEVQYEYWDQHDNRFVSGGKLIWEASGAGNLWEDGE